MSPLSPMERALDIIKQTLGPALEAPLQSIASRKSRGIPYWEYYNKQRREQSRREHESRHGRVDDRVGPRLPIVRDGQSIKWTPDNVHFLVHDQLHEHEMRQFFGLKTATEANALGEMLKMLLGARNLWASRDDAFNSGALHDFLKGASNLLNLAGLRKAGDDCRLLFPKVPSRFGEDLEKLPEAERSNLSICDHLIRLGVPRFREFTDAGYADATAIEDYIEIWQLPGRDGLGLPPDLVLAEPDPNPPPLPRYVWDARERLEIPEKNNPMAFVTRCLGPLSDVGGALELRLADGDWHLRESIQGCGGKLREDMAHRVLDLREFPGHLTVGVTVECTRDQKFVLCRRVGKERLAANPKEWSVGVGEIMHRVKDADVRGALHPHRTVLRALREELGLRDESKDTEVRYLAVTLAIKNLSVTPMAHARVDLSSDELMELAKAQAEDREWDRLEAMGCDLNSCMDLVVDGSRPIDPGRPEQLRVAAWSRLGVLYFAQMRFGVRAVQRELAGRRRMVP